MTTTGRISCPFCSGWFEAGSNIIGGTAGVVHSLPQCEQFIRLDAMMFVQAARRAMGIPAPKGEEN